MRILVVGAGMYVLGRGTRAHGTILPALIQASRTLSIEKVTICSTSTAGKAAVERASRELNDKMKTRLTVEHRVADEVLWPGGETFDAAIVSVPDHLHHDLGRQVLEGGMHCLMVKPFAPTLAEGRALTELAEARGLHGAVELHKRFDEQNLLVRRWIQDGSLGRPQYATVEYSQRVSIPRDSFRSWATRTNVFQYLGVHYVDLLHFMTGYLPVRVMALGHRGVLASQGIETPDSVHALVAWRDPANGDEMVSQFAVGWIDPENSTAVSDQRFCLVTSRGRVDCDQKNRGVTLVTPDEGVRSINPYFSEYLAPEGEPLQFDGYGPRSILRFVHDVADLKAGRVVPADLEGRRPTFRSALVSTSVIDAATRSMGAGARWEEIIAPIR